MKTGFSIAIAALYGLVSVPAALAQPNESQAPPICTTIARVASEQELVGALSGIGGSFPTRVADERLRIARSDFDNDGRVDSAYYYGGELMLFDDNDQRVELIGDSRVDWTSDDFNWSQVLGMLVDGGETYFVWARDDVLTYVSRITPALVHNVECRFGLRESSVAREYFVLSEYERLLRGVDEARMAPWEYALRQPGLRSAELLLENGHGVDDVLPPLGRPLLTWSVLHGRADLVEWLLARGADPMFGGPSGRETPLKEALIQRKLDIATRLMEAGAVPTQGDEAWTIDLLRRGVEDRALFRAFVARRGHIPEYLLKQAVESRSVVLEDLVGSRFPVRREETQWHAGVLADAPSWVEGELSGSQRELRDVRRLYERTLPPPTRFARVIYGTYARGWEIMRGAGSLVSDDDLLLFATSACLFFFEADCGPPALVGQVREWAEGLRLACDARLAGTLDPVACSVVMHYAAINEDKGLLEYVIIANVNAQTRVEGAPALNGLELRDLYVAKQGARR